MGIAHAQVVFQSHSGLPADEIVNTWTFAGSGNAVDVAIAADPLLIAFYNAPLGIAQYLSTDLNLIPTVTKWYRLSDASATTPDVHGAGVGFGSPILITPWTPTAGSGSSMSNQVAIALSYHGSHGNLAEHSGAGPRPASRHRGRVFFGPLNTGCSAVDSANHTLVISESVIAGVTAAAETMRTAAPITANWSVWSRKDNAIYAVTGGFMDNRFDTQRRRMEKATTRTGFGLA